MKAKYVHMGQAKIALDLGDGSERGEYVSQDYILHKLGRPHRAINLMYCYYPLDEGWPTRASELPLPDGKTAGFAWDYAYDDYFTYRGGLEGDTKGEPFESIKDVRRHGQDVILTLTIDCAVSDAQLIKIAEDLRPFGRLMLRINHEARGNWFAYNKRYSYKEVGEFFVRFHNILKEHAPHIRTVLCIGDGHKGESGEKMKYEDEFAAAIAATDMWSADTYLALHWGWPFDIAEPGGTTHKRVSNDEVLAGFNYEYERFMARSDNKSRPFVISEFNADGDVTGPYEQATQLVDFYSRLPKEAPFITGVTFYQFRDRGRLGLEIEDPSNPDVGYEQPILKTYKNIMSTEPYLPKMTTSADASFPAKLRWGGSEDADGLEFPINFEKPPTFCEITFNDQDQSLNLMLEINNRWFYKKPGAKTIDLMPAFFDNKAPNSCTLRIFAPPPNGTNDPSQGADWETNYYAQIKNPPEMRIRYAPVMSLND
ncbi:MAG: hypothetical protein FWF81_05150 [Defluviitaleaceae bacterium]|nr:hypothetical protein [Defluviitaleaceae bacterium]